MKSLLSKFSTILSSLSFKLFLILLVTVVFTFTIHSYISARNQSELLEDQVKSSAYRASDFIKQSLYTSMLRNERRRIHSSIELLGQEPGMEVVRIYNKKGEITFSSDSAEIGTTVDLHAEACYACHAADQPLQKLTTRKKARIYKKDERYRVLGLINPIENSPECYSNGCHAHTADQTILGVLDVQLSLRELDRAMVDANQRIVSLAVVIILGSVILIAVIIYIAIYIPIKKLRIGTEMLAEGNLDYTIELDRNDELGLLARSFNRMSRNLKKADRELRDWSQTLEKRVRDKTEKLEGMHRGMVQVEKMASLGKMAATVAHELNNPLSGIVTYAKLLMKKLRRKLSDDDEKETMLEELDLIRAESIRCGNIVKDLLIFARESSAQFQQVQIHRLLERAIKLVQHHLTLQGIHLEREFGLNDESMVCDEEQLVQALVALMVNAIEAMEQGGELTLMTEEGELAGDKAIQIRISDTGIGIPPEIQDKMFDPFFSTKNETKGVGLGLAVVYGIIQRHHGQISVDSTPGKGTTFILTLPRKHTSGDTNNSLSDLTREATNEH